VESLRRVDTDGALRLCVELRCLLKVPMSLWRCALTLVDITTPGLSAWAVQRKVRRLLIRDDLLTLKFHAVPPTACSLSGQLGSITRYL